MKEADIEYLNTNKDETKPIRYNGTIVKLSPKGWGLIVSQAAVKFDTIYFYWSALEKGGINFADLKRGAEVEFTLIKNYIDKKSGEDMGPRAYHIKVIKNGK